MSPADGRDSRPEGEPANRGDSLPVATDGASLLSETVADAGRVAPGIDRRGFLKAAGGATALASLGTGTASAFHAFSTQEYTITSFDGTELQARLYTPNEPGPNPAILMTHGWSLNQYSPLVTVKAAKYANNGYNVLTYTSRGDEFGLQISTESVLYLGARGSDGVEIIEEESRVYVPQRPQ